MPNYLAIGSCLNPQPTQNRVWISCCQTLTCTVTNTHNTPLTLTNTDLSFNIGALYSVTGISINGFTPYEGNLPIVIPVGGTFQIVMDICHTGSSKFDVGTLKIQFTTAEHGLETNNFDFAVAHTIFPYVTPQPLDFGAVIFGTTGTANLSITNPTIGPMNFYIELGPCAESGFDLHTPINPVTIPGQTTDIIPIEWTPQMLDEILECQIGVIVECNGVNTKFDVKGVSEQDCSCLCCDEVGIATENNLLRTIKGFCATTEVFDRSAVCELKRIRFSFTYLNGLTDGLKIWFNPWLWSFWCDFDSKYSSGTVDGPPPVGWFLNYNNSTMGVGVPTPMALIGTGSNFMAAKNFDVIFEAMGPEQFTITFTFFQTQDLEDWTTANLVPNNPKWRRTDISAINPPVGGSLLNNMFPSVYNMPKKLCSLFYLVDPNTTVDGQPFECAETQSINWTSRWYNSGLYGGPSEFTDHSFTFERNGSTVPNLSTVQPTKVYFQITIPPAYDSLNGVIFQLFDETQTNNSVDILTNYDSSRSEITNIGGISVLDNDLESPSDIISLGGGVYQITAHIGTGVNPSGVYRLAAIVYAKDTITVNTFISDPLEVTQTPDLECDGCGIKINDTNFRQYFQSNSRNCIQPVAKERINHFLQIGAGNFKDCLDAWGAPVPDYREYINNITLNVYRRVEDFPTVGQTTFFIWQTHQSNRVIGFPGNWQNLGDMIVEDNGSSLIDINFETRVRWESTAFDGTSIMLANTPTYMNRTSAGPLGSTYVSTLGITNDWRSEVIYLEYKFRFDLSALFGQPYIVNQVSAFAIRPIQNESDNSGFPSILYKMVVEGYKDETGEWTGIEGPICPSDWDQIRVIYFANQNGDFIFFMNPLGGGVPQLQESEANNSPYSFPQMINVLSIDPDFSSGQAAAYLDLTTLTNGTWELCGLISIPPVY